MATSTAVPQSTRKSAMVRVTDAQIRQYKQDGFLIVPKFLGEEHAAAALEGFFDNFAAPYEDWAADGGNDPDGVKTHGGTAAKPRVAARPATVFPWAVSLFKLKAHPSSAKLVLTSSKAFQRAPGRLKVNDVSYFLCCFRSTLETG